MINFDMTSTAAAACCLMTDESAKLALLTACKSDLLTQMIAEVHDDLVDSHWIAFLRSALSA